jgi:hypothetical protein
LALTRNTDVQPSPSPVASAAGVVPSSSLWEDVPTVFAGRCTVMEVTGESDTGRSTFALSAPGPIAYIHPYEKVGGLFERTAATGKVVRPCPIGSISRGSTDAVMATSETQAAKLEAALTDAYKWARTIILDNHPEVWQILQLARLGSMNRDDRSKDDNRKGQLVYGEMNARWNSIFKQYRINADKFNRTNLIIIGKLEDEYNGKDKTGKRVPKAQKDTLSLIDIRLRTRCDLVVPPGSPRGTQPESVFTGVIEKPWFAGDMRGFEVPQIMLNFATVMQLITGVPAEEWT